MAYDSSSKTIAIDQPVSIADVQAALSTNYNSVVWLCALPQINKWSRFKPIPDKNPNFDITAGNNYRVTHDDSIYIKEGSYDPTIHLDGTCGIYMRTAQTISALVNEEMSVFDWMYFSPGALNSRLGNKAMQYLFASRLGDFRGYYHNAKNPFTSLNIPSVLDKNGIWDIWPVIQLQTTDGTLIGDGGTPNTKVAGSLTPSELLPPDFKNPTTDADMSLSQAYLGIAVIPLSSSGALLPDSAKFVTGEAVKTTTGGTAPYVRFKFGENTAATVFAAGSKAAIVQFFSNMAIAYNSAGNIKRRFIRVPDAPITIVTFGDANAAKGVIASIRGTKRQTSAGYWTVSVTFTVEIQDSATSTSLNVPNCYFRLLTASGGVAFDDAGAKFAITATKTNKFTFTKNIQTTGTTEPTHVTVILGSSAFTPPTAMLMSMVPSGPIVAQPIV